MQLGMTGLGRMGASMARRLMKKGHSCVAFDTRPVAVTALETEGATSGVSVEDLVSKLQRPRAIWLVVPAGIVDDELKALTPYLDVADIVIDGGNSFYRDDVRRAKSLRDAGVHYVDVGTSGGVAGQDRGYCLMIGGEEAIAHHRQSSLRGTCRMPPAPRQPTSACSATPWPVTACYSPTRIR